MTKSEKYAEELKVKKLISFVMGEASIRYIHFVDLWFQVRRLFKDIEKFRELIWEKCHVASAVDDSIAYLQYLDRLRNTDNKRKTPRGYWKLRRASKYNFLVRIDDRLQELLTNRQ